MSRFSRYDSDEERLPEGMVRVGYDADEEVYTFQDTDGSLWESAPGNQYGRLTRVSGPRHSTDVDDSNDAEFLLPEQKYPPRSWRSELMPLLNFGIIIGLSLLLLGWYLHAQAAKDKSESESGPEPVGKTCPENAISYNVNDGDSCWSIADTHSIGLGDFEALNPELDCSKLPVGVAVCVPETPSTD
ncbi:hypothetical protein N3K66_008663 [Trichothecium roseum]|uniref:Uncharacterized protein n=1 Tax=Trichothecium roseum TaxID=47278 RepID=A0ACC0US58_9HYPO|nr:hypothetical protein N3K66_008663 [Trichothecium roseum]